VTDTRSFAALRQPAFRAYYAGASLAMMADSIEHVISYWIIFQKFQSPALGGFAIVSHWLPFLLFSVYTGSLADRRDPRRMIQIGMGLLMLVSVGWGVLFLTDTLQMWHAMALLVVHGVAGAIWSPVGQLYLHEVTDQARLPSAVRLMATVRHLGFLLGPALGGVMLLAAGPAYGIFLNALIYLPLILWLRKAPYSKKPATPRLRGFADIVQTVKEISSNRIIMSMVLLAGSAALLVGHAYQAQMPEFSHDLGHPHADLSYSMLLGADAAGALVAGLVLESRGLLPPNPRSAFVLAMLWCVVIAAFAAVTSYPLALALLFLVGFVELSFNAMAQTLVQLHAPAHLRGRVIGLYSMSNLGLRTFSGITVGLGGSLVGIHWSLAMSAALLLVVLMCGLLFVARAR
jgi:MFS family permease